MANNAVLRSADLTDNWVRLANEPLVADVAIMAMSTGGMAYSGADFEIRQDSESARWPANNAVRLQGVDLSTLEVRSTFQSMRLVLIGNTR